MKIDEIKKVYDIRLENQKLAVDIFKHRLQTKNVSGKNKTFNTYEHVATVYPENIEEYITMLLDSHYFSRLDFQLGMLGEVTTNPLNKLKLMLLSRENKILEAIYNPYDIVNNLNVITTSITYINMYTGIINTMNLDNLGPVTPEKISALEASDFVNINNSYTYQVLNETTNNLSR